MSMSGAKKLSVEDGSDVTLNGTCVYILRNSSKRALGEETFQREVMMGRTGPGTERHILHSHTDYCRNGGCQTS